MSEQSYDQLNLKKEEQMDTSQKISPSIVDDESNSSSNVGAKSNLSDETNQIIDLSSNDKNDPK